MIQRVEVYRTKGKTFDTLKKALEHRENLVEEFLRKLPGFDTMRAKDRITFIQSILNRREELRELLDYSSTPISDDDDVHYS